MVNSLQQPEMAWLDQVETVMRRAGMPNDYTARARGELADHIAESGAPFPQQPAELAADFVRAFRSSGWLQWMPPAVWLLLPLPLAVLLPVAYLLACEWLLETIFEVSDATGAIPGHVATTAYAMFWAGKAVVPAIGVALFFRLSQRMARPWCWTAALFLLFAFATAATHTTLELTIWEQSEYTVGLGTTALLQNNQLPQAILVLAVGMGAVLRQRRSQLAECHATC